MFVYIWVHGDPNHTSSSQVPSSSNYKGDNNVGSSNDRKNTATTLTCEGM